VYVCLSSDVLPQIRIYERASTTVFNACVGPVLRKYVESLLKVLAQNGFEGVLLIMQSNGGMMSPEVAMDFAANTLLSGPAGGPKAGIFYGAIHNVTEIITIDMGGTSFDCCLIRDGRPEITVENDVNMFRMAMPSIAIHTIGAGGGSLAYLDERGILCVGPQSAGALPGPVCYGLGGETPTVTDADLVLGYLNPDYFLGGKIKLQPNKATEAIAEKIAHPLDLEVSEAAYGIYQIVNGNMAQGVRVVSVEKGYDPRFCMLVTGGGAGPVHACEIAKELEIPLILVPKASSVFCATGMLISNLRHDFVKVCHMIMTEECVNVDLINLRYKEMEERAFATLKKEGVSPERMRFTYSCDLKYEGQFNEIEVPTPLSPEGAFTLDQIPMLQRAFDESHDILYGYSLPGTPVELVCLRLVGEGIVEKPTLSARPFIGEDTSGTMKGKREIYFEEHINVPIYDGTKIGHGNKLSGPAIIEEPTTTIFVAPSYQLTCDKFDNYLIYSKKSTLEEILSRVRNR
jgi:N-methylhydantoinase A